MSYTFQWGQAAGYVPYLAGGALLALQIAFFAFAIGMVIGAIGAAIKTFGGRMARWLIDAYVGFFANTPLLVQIFFLFYALPDFGILVSSYQAVLIGLALNAGAYLTEIQRAGFQSARRGELDAGETLGFTRLQAIRLVIMPHVLRTLYPPLASHYIAMTLSTSTAAVFGVEELTGRALNVNAITFRSFEIFAFAALMYVALTIVATLALYWFGRWMFRVKGKVF
jgi:polar amino acid transport system permease protein